MPNPSDPWIAFPSKRGAAVRQRWLEVMVYGTTAGSIFPILVWLFPVKSRGATALPSWSLALSALLILTLLIHLAYSPRGWRWGALLGLRHFWTHPPTWVGAILGLTFTYFVGACVPELRLPVVMTTSECILLSAIGLATAAFLPFYAWKKWPNEMQSHTQADQTTPLPRSGSNPLPNLLDFSAVKTWLKDDRPVESQDGDRFGYQRCGSRMALRMRQTPLPSQAVVGQLGSGKSTLGNLVGDELRKTEEKVPNALPVRLVRVELWPFETPKAAVEGILNTLLDQISEDVNILGLRSIPAQYTNAMQAIDGWPKILATLLNGSPSSPANLLGRIDRVATAIGIRYVLWVEDLERFACAKVEGDDHERDERERLQPITAVLHALNERHSLGVVTATTRLSSYFDLKKIARHIVKMPTIERQDATRILKIFRDGCMNSPGFVDSAPESRKDLNQMEAFSTSTVDGDSHLMGVIALPMLCQTPRTLKQGLRHCLDFWEAHPGELDFDDLLAISLLREGVPSAFAYVQDHLQELQNTSATPFTQTDQGKNLQTALVDTVGNGTLRNAAIGAVGCIFGNNAARKKPQGFATSRKDYWKKYLDEPNQSEEKDQFFLRSIEKADESGLLDLMENAMRRQDLSAFTATMLGADRLINLLEALVKRRMVEDPSTWPVDERKMLSPPGLESLHHCWEERLRIQAPKIEIQAAESAVLAACRISVGINLPFASALIFYLVQNFPFLSSDTKAKARIMKDVGESIQKAYTGQPETLAAQLKATPHRALADVFWMGNDEHGQVVVPNENWSKFAKTLLGAAKLDFGAVIPHIAQLVVSPGNQSPFEPVYIPDRARALFSESSIRDLIQGHDLSEFGNDPWVQVLIRGVNPA